MAVQTSVTALPVAFRAADLATRSNRAVSAGYEETTRATFSSGTFGSAMTFCTRMTISGNYGRLSSLDNAAASFCTKPMAMAVESFSFIVWYSDRLSS